jgi:hypothetical protein
VVHWVGTAKNGPKMCPKWAQNGTKMGILQKTFLFLQKVAIFFNHHILLPIVGLKKYRGGTVVRWAGTTQNGIF